MKKRVLVAGSGNAALCAGIAALEKGASVTLVEKAPESEAGGNTRYTAGAMRFAYDSKEDLLPLLNRSEDPKIERSDFGSYPKEKFAEDLLKFNQGLPLSECQKTLVEKSYETLLWLGENGIRFDPIYSRQSFEKNGRYVFWGGLVLESEGEGDGLFQKERERFLQLGGKVEYGTEAVGLIRQTGKIRGLECQTESGRIELEADAVILGAGGFEASPEKRARYIGEAWKDVKVRGTKHNTGRCLDMALAAGAQLCGLENGCHAVPMDLHMPDYGNPEIPFRERKHYRKICYFLGVMLNAQGQRFVDEGINFRNYTYAQFGKAIVEQPGNFAWQVFDSKIDGLLYGEYTFRHASFVEADTLEALAEKMTGLDGQAALKTIAEYNAAVSENVPFDPTILDGKSAKGVSPPKSNWANKIDTPPFKAYPVTCGITFSYYGLRINDRAAVTDGEGKPIGGLYACGEMVGDVFYGGYPGGSGLTSGAVFGRLAGNSAALD